MHNIYYRTQRVAQKPICLLSAIAFLGLSLLACQRSQGDIIEASLKNFYKDSGLREFQVDFILSPPSISDKAYASATLTHNFANRHGDYQKEYIGHILRKVNNQWEVEKKTKYTRNEDEAILFLKDKKSAAEDDSN
jgi:hypothetical protein